MTIKNTNRAVCQDNLNSIIELVNILDLGIDQGRNTPGSSLTSVLAESGNMLYLFYDPQLMIRIIDKTTWLPIQDYVPTDCTFSIGLIPDFTNGTQFYGIWHGQNIKVFNILTTTVQIYYPFFQNITNILDVGGNIPKLIFVALIGDFFILDVTQGTIFFQGFGTLMNQLNVGCYDKANHILGLGSTNINYKFAIASHNRNINNCHPSCYICTGDPVPEVDHRCFNCRPGLNGILNSINSCIYSCSAGNYPNQDYSNCTTCPSCCSNCELFTGNSIAPPYVPNTDDLRCNTAIPLG